MQILKDKIIEQGEVRPGNVLKADGFLNQQMDMNLYDAMGASISEYFADKKITKVLTIEASGIALACVSAQHLGMVPVIFAKKHATLNRDASVYSTPIFSFTHKTEYNVTIAKRFISPDDNVLIVDDFLASGEAFYGLIDLVHQAGAHVCGLAVAVEKGFMPGGEKLRKDGYDLLSLAIVDEMDDCTIKFRPEV